MTQDTKGRNLKKSTKPRKTVKTLDGDEEIPVSGSELVQWISSLLLIIVAIALIISYISNFFTGAADQNWSRGYPATNWLGSMGVLIVKYVIDYSFGLATIFLPIFMIALAFRILQIGRIRLWKWLLNCAILMIWFSVAGALLQKVVFKDYFLHLGGMHGISALTYLCNKIGMVGALFVIVVTAIAYMGYLSGETVRFIRRTMDAARRKANKTEILGEETGDDILTEETEEGQEEQQAKRTTDTATTVKFGDLGEEEQPAPLPNIDMEVVNPNQPTEETNRDGMEVHIGEPEDEAEFDSTRALEPYDPKLDLSHYKYPTIDLLKKYDTAGAGVDMDELRQNKDQILRVLHNFKVEISNIKATVGPTVTLYEVTPAPGIRIATIRNLEDDIALSLSAKGIRIIAPIPGKGTVGIEVPNAKPQMVSMESLINSKKFQETEFELPMALGKTITNEIFMVDLAKMPHLLVAGATGQGKSVGLNAIITSLLYKKHPAELKLVMVDPKKVEFSVYNPIVNHFLAQVEGNEDTEEPIITDVNKVVQTLKSLCLEMDTRYDLLKKARARNIKEYNEKFKERKLNPNNGHKFMPYIVVIIDEFGDLIMTAGKEIELPIARIAQLARAVGIHMIIATQRPTTNIITGTIKANFPARMAFKVSAMVDSRTILDRPGANQLVGKGDMLFLAGMEPVRVQCAFVDTPEVEAIANFIACQQSYNHPFPLPPVAMEGEEGSGGDVDMDNLDPMLETVAKLVVQTQQGSTSMIQRKFSIGYNRAGRLMDQLEHIGVVGPAQGSKPREVLVMGDVELLQILNNIRG